MIKDNENYLHSELTEEIIGQAFNVYNALGSGFLESVYKRALTKKLREKGFDIICEHPIKVYFEGENIGDYCCDILVNELVIVELKAIETLAKIHEVQLVNYLKATNLEVGLLINFGEKIEIKRKVLTRNHKKSALSASEKT
ncbi:MAG: GxxExxY protein [Ignavibacteria bacterium]